MDWTRQIDNYCERLSPDFWAEPWNAVTNAFFILAAVAGYVYAARQDRLDWPLGRTFITSRSSWGSAVLYLFPHFADALGPVIADVIPIPPLHPQHTSPSPMRQLRRDALVGRRLATAGVPWRFSAVGGKPSRGDLFRRPANGIGGISLPAARQTLLAWAARSYVAGRTGGGGAP